jgi:microcystin-dependent protein
MGGTDAGRLTASYFGTAATVLGAAGGSESQTLTSAQMPAHTHSGTTGIESNDHTHGYSAGSSRYFVDFTDADVWCASEPTGKTTGGQSAHHTHNFTTASAGSGNAHNNVQPTMICNYILYAGA